MQREPRLHLVEGGLLLVANALEGGTKILPGPTVLKAPHKRNVLLRHRVLSIPQGSGVGLSVLL